MSRPGTKPCIVDGCDRLGHGTYCGAHANRLRMKGELGSPVIRRMLPKGMLAVDKIDAIGWTVTELGCWEWNGRRDATSHSTYGRVDNEHSFPVLAHRVAYEKWVGPLEADDVLMHSCDNTICINPAHLSPGTTQDNLADMYAKGRGWNQAKTHCKRGHEFTEDNIYWRVSANGRPGRKCRTCIKLHSQRAAA